MLLVGGSSRIPIVQSTVRSAFDMDFISTANLDQVVGLGAAVYAGYKANKDGSVKLSAAQQNSLARINVSEVTNKCFGTVAQGTDKQRENSVIIKKNTKLPCSETKMFVTVYDGQTSVDCAVTESVEETTDLTFVKIVSENTLELPPGRPKGQEVEVSFSFDDNQIMHCSFHDIASGKRTEVDLKLGGSATTSIEDDGNVENIDEFLVE